ncbi:hypothetical protein NDU88_005221 [Pleurodeles waltl]|uniref:Uncharacterized protein n=1 Tax=Pleurodeles waltl TaxID=8319 RepID=A0AAV7TAZ3_PLEWA|nr:hypothetical protein NDU88_005221 [Pleurodeles waltl]
MVAPEEPESEGLRRPKPPPRQIDAATVIFDVCWARSGEVGARPEICLRKRCPDLEIDISCRSNADGEIACYKRTTTRVRQSTGNTPEIQA